jgi:LAO/AO transport system kinase
MLASDQDRALIAGVRAGHRRALAKAITLIESSRCDHQGRAQAMIEALQPETGRSLRIGISGAPGVGKSTFIEALGLHVIARGHRVAVLAVDPTSRVTGGSILGDKTRMEQLARAPAAFIRPSPAGTCLGGVAACTREAMLLCEAAGFDVILVETVGVGQSETAVARMTDLMVLLQLPMAGDDLQALKKGIVELADLIVINKADLAPEQAALAQQTLQSVLAILRPTSRQWQPPVMALSSLDGQGIPAVWTQVERYHQLMHDTGEFDQRRCRQALDWMWHLIEDRLRTDFRAHPQVKALLPDITDAVTSGKMSPSLAATRLLEQTLSR